MAVTSDREISIEAEEPATFIPDTTVVKNITGFGETRFLSRIQSDSFDFEKVVTITDTVGSAISMVAILTAVEEDPRTFIMREFVDVTFPSPATIAEYDIILNEFIDSSGGGWTMPSDHVTDISVAPPDDFPAEFTVVIDFTFSEHKKDRLVELYGLGSGNTFGLPELPAEPEDREALDIEAQSAISNDIISYSSLSSLSEAAIEQLNISTEGGTLTVTTIEEVEVVEDVGGVTSFARGTDRSETGAARGTRTVGSDTADVRRSY